MHPWEGVSTTFRNDQRPGIQSATEKGNQAAPERGLIRSVGMMQRADASITRPRENHAEGRSRLRNNERRDGHAR